MAVIPVSSADFERAMSQFFREGVAPRAQFVDSDFESISRLLAQWGKPHWSCRPRTYAVLRMIDRIDLFEDFISHGLKDIAFPYTENRLPPPLNPSAKAKFLRAQSSVVTKASDLERIEGRHRHLAENADVHFQRIKILGRGGFGEVDHVRSKLSLEEYARKRVHRNRVFLKDREAIETFENELTNLKRLSHHHLVQYVGSYTDPKYVGLLISPVADCDLKAFLERAPFPKEDHVLLRGFLGCLCSAVSYLHSSKCRHKDLKPANILISMNRVLITDFGTALDWSELSCSTTTGMPTANTRLYAAPEVLCEEPRGSSSDIWSLGCIFLDIMTVLRGFNLIDRKLFFAENGNGNSFPSTNAKALELWLLRLQSAADIEPLQWIRRMLKFERLERITAAGLLAEIYSCRGENTYYSACCNEDDSEGGTSYEGSVIDEGDLDQDPTMVGATITDVPIPNNNNDKRSSRAKAMPLPSLEIQTSFTAEFAYQSLKTASESAHPSHQTDPSLANSNLNFRADDSRIIGAFLIAAREGHEAVVRLLLQNGVSVEASGTENKTTALIEATQQGREAVVRLLLQKGASVEAKDKNKSTALHIAVKGKYEAVVRLLLKNGANIETRLKNGCTPLLTASYAGNERMVRLLLEHGAQVEAGNESDQTALSMAGTLGHKAVLLLLLEKGAQIDATDRYGYTVLLWAAQRGHGTIVRLLLEKGAKIEVRGNNGCTALLLAARAGHETLVGLLLTKGAEIEACENTGCTALLLAAGAGHEATVRLLVAKGARIDVRSNYNHSSLMLAAKNGHAAVVRVLLDMGADTYASNSSQNSAGEVAMDSTPTSVHQRGRLEHHETGLEPPMQPSETGRIIYDDDVEMVDVF